MKKELTLAVLCAALLPLSGCGQKKDDSATDIFAASPTPEAVERYITVSVAGNVTLAANVNPNDDDSFAGIASAKGSEYFFRNASDYFKDDDLTLVNLDCVISDSSDSSSSGTKRFRADKSYVDILKSGGIEAVSLANEHTTKFGSSGLSDTKAALEEANITWCNTDEPSIYEYNGVKVGLIGVYVEDGDYSAAETSLSDSIDALKESAPDVTIVSLHWGEADSYEPSDDQVDLAHKAVDLGANLVVGTHPYYIQGIEKYNGSVICYSLGNFCYGGGQCPEDYKDSFIFRQTFTIGSDGSVIDDDAYEIVPFNVSSVESSNNYQPTPAEPDVRYPRIKQTITRGSKKLGDDIILWFANDESDSDTDDGNSDSSDDN